MLDKLKELLMWEWFKEPWEEYFTETKTKEKYSSSFTIMLMKILEFVMIVFMQLFGVCVGIFCVLGLCAWIFVLLKIILDFLGIWELTIGFW
tara:strand:+ start:604 stop:879 length:276 start_codon:yes stop_codon:yes gene_type:complete